MRARGLKGRDESGSECDRGPDLARQGKDGGDRRFRAARHIVVEALPRLVVRAGCRRMNRRTRKFRSAVTCD